MAEEVKKHGLQKVIVPIDSVPYTVDAFLSINDFEQLVDADEENAKLAVAEFIQKRIVDTGLPTPTVETIAEQEDICFQELINALLDDDQTLKECYAKRDESEPLCTRFVLAAKETADIWAKNLAEAFKKIDHDGQKIQLRKLDKMVIRNQPIAPRRGKSIYFY